MEFINRFTPLNFDNPINQGLVAYYPMNERTGPVAFDMSKNNFHGDLINSPTHALSGRFGDVLDFDPASTQYVDCGTAMGNALGNNVSALSVSLWFKNDSAADNGGLFYLGDFNSSDGEFFIASRFDEIRFDMSNDAFDVRVGFTDTIKWHHLVAMYTGSRGILYIDNVKVIDEPHSTNLNLSGLKTIIGAFYFTSFTLDGKMKNLRIYNRVLQPSIRKTLFLNVA